MRPSAFVVALALLVAGCGDNGSTPAGEQRATGEPTAAGGATTTDATPEPAVLRMAFTRGYADQQVEMFQDELDTRSDGAVTLQLDEQFSTGTHGVEQDIVRAVADGRLDLGWVGVRAFSELGVSDLDPLVAPMVLDSMAAQEAVLSSDLPEQMLTGLEALDVEGLAVIGGHLRRPVAAEAPLTQLSDFEGITFYTFRGALNAISVESLGATNVDLAPAERNAGIEDGSIRAYEIALTGLAGTADRRANQMTVNINLWPSVSVLMANPDTLSSLDAGHHEALRAAAQATATRSLTELSDEQSLAEEACEAGAGLAVAEDDAVAEIENALEPVIDQLRADPQVAAYLDEIEDLTAGLEPEPITVPGCDALEAADDDQDPSPEESGGQVSPVDGTYAVSWTATDLAAALEEVGIDDAELAYHNAGNYHLVLDRGRYNLQWAEIGTPSGSCPGTFEVDGDRIFARATTRPSEWECGDGLGAVAIDATWTLTDDQLTLTEWDLPETEGMIHFLAALLGSKPLERVAEDAEATDKP